MNQSLRDPNPPTSLQRIRARGLVQGVGFRPLVWQLAKALALCGRVFNDGDGVVIEVYCEREAALELTRRLRGALPPLARIDALEMQTLCAEAPMTASFYIEQSQSGAANTAVGYDSAACAACIAEVIEASDRRFGHPFNNCTHCGPRFSVIQSLPYDRQRTSMARFALCAACQREYVSTEDRRFHAQPVACNACGPRLSNPASSDEAALLDTVAALVAGDIVAIKSLGGFNLLCRADSPQAVSRLRSLKARPDKPFAVMVKDLDMAAQYAELSAMARDCLGSPRAPIVLCPSQAPMLASVAPGLDEIGLMLAYTPLHYLLLEAVGQPLVCTSGNRHGDPQCIDNAQALAQLAGLADQILLHDRDIVQRVDDSVLRVIAKRPRLIRRARGYVPQALALPAGFDPDLSVFAAGAGQKNTFCLWQGGRAIVSPHMGELNSPRSIDAYQHQQAQMQSLFGFEPQVVAVDQHSGYRASTLGASMAQSHALALIAVQHHHAHGAACLLEYAKPANCEPHLAVLLDGLGLGEDGTLWGGEILALNYQHSQRLACLLPVAQFGGDAVASEPWRSALAQLLEVDALPALRRDYPDLPLWQQPDASLKALSRLGEGDQTIKSSACARLFDAAAYLLGACKAKVSYEGQAGMALERLAQSASFDGAAYDFGWRRGTENAVDYLDPAPMWRQLLDDLKAGVATATIAARFHQGLANAFAQQIARLQRERAFPEDIVLSGGCFQNRRLAEALINAIDAAGLVALLPEQYPANDGGLSLGQAAVAAAQTQKRGV